MKAPARAVELVPSAARAGSIRTSEKGSTNCPVSSRKAGKRFAVCEQIMRRRPGWRVIWGPVTGLYWAFPLFEAPDWIPAVRDRDPEKLLARMDEVERLAGYKRPPSPG
jgi:hypothetical protein